MIQLNTEAILFHLLSRADFMEFGISHKTLREMRNAVNKSLEMWGLKVNIDFCLYTPDLAATIELYPKYFAWGQDSNKIFRAQYSEEQYSENHHKLEFSPYIPKNIANLVLEVLESNFNHSS